VIGVRIQIDLATILKRAITIRVGIKTLGDITLASTAFTFQHILHRLLVAIVDGTATTAMRH
jgi:hypothetical protein